MEGLNSKALYIELIEKGAILGAIHHVVSSIPTDTFFPHNLDKSLSAASTPQSLKSLVKRGFQKYYLQLINPLF